MRGERYARGIDPDVKKALDGLQFASYNKAIKVYQWLLKEPQEKAHIRYACCVDRYFLLTCILRRPDAFHPWLYDRCREVERQPDNAIDLWARYHYKSTIITFAGAIQEIILDPEITIAIFSVTDKIAGLFQNQIKEELETNDFLVLELFPDVFWAKPRVEASQWAADGITVKRQGNPKEATIRAYGLLQSLPTGSHFKLRIYDDVINEKVTTQTDSDQIKKITTQWELSQNLGDGRENRKWHIGTRYLIGDTYGDLLSRDILTPRVHPATKNGKLDGELVFLDSEEWERIKREQKSVVAAQMLQNPLATSANTFMMEHLKSFPVRPQLLNIYILGDPSKGRTKRSDRTALVVIGVDSAKNRYLLDGYCHRMRLSERYDNLKDLYTKWTAQTGVQHVRIGYEVYGMQTDDEYFEERFLRDKIAPDLVEVNWVRQGSQSKNDRIERLEPYFRESQFWLPPRVWVPTRGECLWHVDPETLQVKWTTAGDTVTKLEAACIARGEKYRVMKPITRINEDRQPYDLVREFIDEYGMHPFSPRDDFLDAASRIEDVEPDPPVTPQALRELEPVAYAD